MQFIFNKGTRKLMQNLLQRKKENTDSRDSCVPSKALERALQDRHILPVVDFDEDGDIQLPPTYEASRKLFREFNMDKGAENYGGDVIAVGRRDMVLSMGDSLSTTSGIDKKRHCRKLVNVFKRFLFSQIGVGCLVILYVILGGLMFDAIESSNEKIVKERQRGNIEQFSKRLKYRARMLFNKHLNDSFELKYKHWRDYQRRANYDREWNVDVDPNEWHEMVKNELAIYEKDVDEAGFKNTKDQEEKQTEIWTVTSAMLYSATVITTIGYGNITPKTTQGKILTMIYALFGIPLMFICLTNTGDTLANVFINTYSRIVNFFCLTCCTKRFRKMAGYSSSDISQIPDDQVMGYQIAAPQSKHAAAHYASHQERKHVPIVASLGALGIYIFGGAMLFGAWEGWKVIDGAYFCFITFTTIGFGDFVPGQGLLSKDKSGKMIVCSMFLLVGMIVMAMCFKLMQDELVSKIRTIGKKLGIVENYDS